MMGKIYGYVRVSSRDQNEARQMVAMRDINIPAKNIFIDKQSGKDFQRPMYQKLLRKLSAEDVLYIMSIDRLGRNYSEILEQWKIITKDKKTDIVVMNMPILDTRRGKDLLGTFLADVVLTLLSYVAENERQAIHQRQAEGIAAAKERGVKFGRSPIPLPECFSMVYEDWVHKKISLRKAAELCNMPKSTFYDKAKKYK